jgi:hypothetical protein
MAKRNKRIISLAVCALALAAGLTVKPAMAYFTDYTTAGGTVEISVKNPSTSLTEGVWDFTKHITITNNGEAECFIRVAAIAPNDFTLSLGSDSEGWSYNSEDAYYYYSDPVAPGESAHVLDIAISGVGVEKIENQDSGNQLLPSDFNVIILQESVKALYDAEGNAYGAWAQAISEGGQ